MKRRNEKKGPEKQEEVNGGGGSVIGKLTCSSLGVGPSSSAIIFRQPVVARRTSSPSKPWKGRSRKDGEEEDASTTTKKRMSRQTTAGRHSKADTNTLQLLLESSSSSSREGRRRTRSSTSSTTSSVSSSSVEESDDGRKSKDRNKGKKGKAKKKSGAADKNSNKGKKLKRISNMGPHYKDAVNVKEGSSGKSTRSSSSNNNQGALVGEEKRKAGVEMTKGATAGTPSKTYNKRDEPIIQQNFKGPSRMNNEPKKREFPLPSSTSVIKNYRIPKTIQKSQEDPSQSLGKSRKRSINDRNAGAGDSSEDETDKKPKYYSHDQSLQNKPTATAIIKGGSSTSGYSKNFFAPGIQVQERNNKTLSDYLGVEESKIKRRSRYSPIAEDVKKRNAAHVTFLAGKIEQPQLEQPQDNVECESMEWENQLPEIFRMVTEGYDSVHQSGLVDGDGDVEMEDMDVDVDPAPNNQLIIVPDTNIFISCSGLIKKLVDSEFPKVSLPYIVIPWMVLQELDYRMHGNNSKKVRPAVNAIHSFLSNRHPRVKGQKAAEALVSKHQFDELMADDSIMNCVIQLKSTNALVVFLTNDKNLLNKALVNGVIACDSESIFKTINSLLNDGQNNSSEASSERTHVSAIPYQNFSPTFRTDHGVNHSHNNSPFSQSAFGRRTNGNECFTSFPSPSSLGGINQHSPKVTRSEPNTSVTEVSKVFQEVLETFSCIIKHKMIEDFGEDGWEYALKIKPPWTFKTAVKCILTHWLANFSYVFHRKGEAYLEKLSQLIQKYEMSSPSEKTETERNIIEACLSIFNLMTNDISNLPAVITCRKSLMNFVIAHDY